MATLSPTEIRQYVTCPSCGKEGPSEDFVPSMATGARPRRSTDRQCLDCQRSKRLQWQYNITLTDYDRLLDLQDGGCAGCGEPSVDRSLQVDHDHSCCSGIKSCGKCVRGLLCHRCNKALGLIGDDLNVVTSLAAYLMERSSGNA